jgi:DNA-binding GntR family transcriptional regulator
VRRDISHVVNVVKPGLEHRQRDSPSKFQVDLSPGASVSDLPGELVHLTQTNFREQARRAIRAHIIAGNIKAGELVSARALASQLGVSATPVREALLDLANERLLTAVRNQGFLVTTPSDQDLRDILEIRLMLEVPAMVGLAGRLPADRHPHHQQMAATIHDSATSGDVIGFLEADRDFHLGLLSEIGNHRLVEMVAILRDQVRLYGLPRLAEEQRLADSADEHVELIDSIVRGDAQLTEQVMRRHLRHTTGIWAGREG